MKKTLYIFQNGELRRKDNSLYFETEERKRYIPVENTNDIYIFGEVDVSKRFLEFAAQKEIIVHYFNHYGYYVGSFYPREHLNSGHVVLKQAEHYLDPRKRLELARLFVQGSIRQMERVLKYYRPRLSEPEELEKALQSIEQEEEKLDQAETVEQLMAVEGHIREVYYASFDSIIRHPDFVFEKRTKRPPHNRLNALISFGNSIVYTMCLSEIYKTYLDPRIGFLHSTNFRRFSLNLDIAEIFKPIIVDRLIFALVNKKMLSSKHFEKLTNGIMLNEEGRKLFVSELEKKMQTTVQHRHLGKSVSYRRLIRLELYKIQKHILGEKTYEPYAARW
ncbi:type I-B CRISPR-associated endonuclease Cas1b [Geobacillus stearothermophilus]|uniref:type I-B CRISPR-associated endonuclease Cas1b n=1 Tax=Geobacillus stearothermophilus TaxID=1422 RepID=UPI002E1CDAC9|nr:type I-B CRISPR-associated endonuclease Cas1b [Geobacillus stearothermophilus]MED3720442.1 type I-B CRISPR-associated endonuclease Cas1b [Geobacillus stearothermophilus]MED3721941.1 type I-B CRISPR-associated endonuclease Cas1b [Geobacillus stearothermophilus]MED3770443.1 type I-B CRISPR-associated endonuclease Cas1b [Geobacillus stearothermophilus]MED3772702.1 type I-B CRISPR-associated endonuclease Cas1b [Geobacillus stearothermophilus]MED4870851.1 type I-B CRISPR-associated endonuclease 